LNLNEFKKIGQALLCHFLTEIIFTRREYPILSVNGK